MEIGDVIHSVNGEAVKDSRDLAPADRRHRPGDAGKVRRFAQRTREDHQLDLGQASANLRRGRGAESAPRAAGPWSDACAGGHHRRCRRAGRRDYRDRSWRPRGRKRPADRRCHLGCRPPHREHASGR